MADTVFDYPDIRPGFPFDLVLQFDTVADLFPLGSAVRADFRPLDGAGRPVGDVLVAASTGAGFTRVDSQTLQIALTPAQTRNLRPGRVGCDLIRTDTSPDQHMNIEITLNVRSPLSSPT